MIWSLWYAGLSEVARHLEWLKQLDNTRMAAMTGSGACVFAEFATEPAAQAALAQVPAGMKGFVAQRIGSSSHA